LVKNFVIEKLISVLTSEDPQFEEFIYLAEEVYESKTNDILKTTRIKTQKIIGKEWSEIDITIKYLELCKMFNFKS
jgi:hypothetical protein